MGSARITLARVLELGVRVSWREAVAIVYEALASTGSTEGAGPARVTAESCLLTRGGEVVLTGTAAQARPEAVVWLLDDLLASCSDPGRFAGAVADGTALDMVEEVSQHITPRRRRVEVASVALRGLAAAADAARAMADANPQDPLADFGSAIAAPRPAASPKVRPWPKAIAIAEPPAMATVRDQTSAQRGHATIGKAKARRPGLDYEDRTAAVAVAREPTAPENARAAPAAGPSPAHSTRRNVMELPSAKPQVNAVRTAKDVAGPEPSRLAGGKRAGLVALVCALLVLAAGGVLVLQMPATQRSAVEPSEPAIDPPQIDAPAALDAPPPLARPDPGPLAEVPEPPPVPPGVAQGAPRGSPAIEEPRPSVPQTTQDSVPSIRPAAGEPETPAGNTATAAGSRAPSTTSAAAGVLVPDAAYPAGAAPQPVDPSPVVASPSAAASSPAETVDSASTRPPAIAVTPPPSREAETRAIENVLGRYRTAFNELDAGAAVAVWPTVNEKTLARAFERLESHDVSFETCEIEISSAQAEAACSGTARYVPKVGSRTPRDEARQWRFSLRKASGEWLIDRVDAR